MTLHETIKRGIVDAMKAKDQTRLQTYRLLSAAMTNEVVAKKRKPDELLTDEESLVVLKRAANQRKDSIQQYEAAGRHELAEPEKAELSIIEEFLPAQMSREDVEAVVRRKMEDTGSTDKSSAGKLTGSVMQELKGQVDGSIVKEVVDSLLT